MEMRGFTFPEAVRYLAKQAGITLPEESTRQTASSDRSRLLREIINAASDCFREALGRSSEAKEYIRHRGLLPATVDAFQLGFAPKGWEFIFPHVVEKLKESEGHSGEEEVRAGLVELGLLKKKEGGATDAAPRYYDAFRERLIFPVAKSDGRPIAFGGRTIRSDDDAPKYINSSESLLYSKRRSLFGVHQAMPAARRDRTVYLVEGYMDVLSFHQAGITETVATCGTAVTPQHAEVLRRFVDSAVVVFDGDSAGRKAAGNCFPAFLNSGLDVEVVFLPDGQDPDSAARTMPIDELRKLLSVRTSSAEAYLRSLIEEESGSEELSAAASGRVAERFAAVLSQVKNAVEREFLIRTGATHLGVSAEALDNLVRGAALKRPRAPTVRADSPSPESGSGEAPARAPEKPRRKPQPPVSAGRTHEQIEFIYRQLAVAVLCEPQIAEQCLTLVKANEQARSESEIAAGVTSFISDFLKSDLPGISQTLLEKRASGEPGPLLVANFPSVQALLAAHGLESLHLLEEALRQAQVGGAVPNDVLTEAPPAMDRLVQQIEVHRLRKEERSHSDEDSLLRLAQEKLEKRRTLERMRPGPRPDSQ